MRVLYVSHTAAISGAEHSLLELLSGMLDHASIDLACPNNGPLPQAAARLGVDVHLIPEVEGSLRLDVTETPRTLLALAEASFSIARYVRRLRPNVVHANSIRAGFAALPVALALRVPAIVHVRDRLPRTRVADLSLKLISARATRVIANSHYTAAGIEEASPGALVAIVANPIRVEDFRYAHESKNALRRGLGVPEGRVLAGVVGQITPWKGQADAIRTVSIILQEGLDAHLWIVGEPKFLARGTRYDNRVYYEELRTLTTALNLEDHVTFLGERSDVPDVMAALDVLLVPSWEEPFGRVVVEAMAAGTAVLSTNRGGPSEIIEDGRNGVLLPPREPRVWAAALGEVVRSPQRRAEIAMNATNTACEFTVDKHVAHLLDIYREAAALGHRGRTRQDP